MGLVALASVKAGRIKRGSKFLVFSDSALCIGFLVHGWSFTSWTQLAHKTRAVFGELKGLLQVIFYWVRGHAGIPGNEHADTVAKRAAIAARDSLGLGGQDDEPDLRRLFVVRGGVPAGPRYPATRVGRAWVTQINIYIL